MKRLILMGGRTWLGADKGKAFVETLFRYFPKETKVAFCIFAQPESEWEETQQANTKTLDQFKDERQVRYKTLNSQNFREVSAWADIIYIPGGDPFALKKKLEACGDISKIWDGKVIAGSSAGADVFCEGFIYLQEKVFGRGLGWIKATFIPHWQSDFDNYSNKDWEWAEQECLIQYPNLPVLCIPESEFSEFSVK